MRSAEQRLVDQIAAVPKSSSFVGTFRTMNGVLAVVQAYEGELQIPFVGTVQPSPGDSVQVEMRNGSYAMIGPTRPKPARGSVTAVSAPTPPDEEGGALPDDTARVLVLAGDVEYALPYVTGYEPAVADIVAIQWGFEGGLVTGAVSMIPPVPIVPPVSQGSQSYHPAPFTATGSNSFQGGSWNKAGRVWSSDTAKGVWLYGSKIADTIPDSAVIEYVRLYLSPDQIQGDPANLRLHSNTSFSGGPAWQGSSWPLAPVAGWNQIPNSFVDWLKANPGGLGFDSGGYSIFRSITADPMSGALDITYRA